MEGRVLGKGPRCLTPSVNMLLESNTEFGRAVPDVQLLRLFSRVQCCVAGGHIALINFLGDFRAFIQDVLDRCGWTFGTALKQQKASNGCQIQDILCVHDFFVSPSRFWRSARSVMIETGTFASLRRPGDFVNDILLATP